MTVPPTMPADSVRASAIAYAPMFDSLHFVRTVPVLRGADTALTLGVFSGIRLRRKWQAPTR